MRDTEPTGKTRNGNRERKPQSSAIQRCRFGIKVTI